MNNYQPAKTLFSLTKQTDLAALSFREEGHVYTFKGAVIPSVTQVVDSFVDFNHVPRDVLERARQRGNLVHQLTARWDLTPWPVGDPLDIYIRDAGLAGYMNGWLQFCADFKFQCVAAEQRCYHRKYRYAGTYDRECYLNGLTGIEDLSVLDIKSGEYTPEYAWQTAAYMHAINDGRMGNKVKRRYVVQVTDRGTYKVTEHKDPADFDAFIGALSVMNWRKRYGRA